MLAIAGTAYVGKKRRWVFFSVGRKVEELLFQLILQISRDKISEVGFFWEPYI